MKLEDAIKKRKSIRKYKNTKPDWRQIIEAIDTTRFAPMSGNIFTLKFILVSDPKKIAKIAEESEQLFIAQAQYVVVFVTNSERTTNSFGEIGEDFCRQQAGAAIQNFLLKLTEFKLSTCWIGYFNEPEIKKLLKIPENCKIEAMFPIGYAKEKPKSKNTRELNNMLYFDEWKKNRMISTEKIDSRMPEGYGRNIAKDL